MACYRRSMTTTPRTRSRKASPPTPTPEPVAEAEMRIEHLPLSWLTTHQAPRNPKLHDVEGVSASMGRFGFTIPIALDEQTSTVVAGHGRIEVLTAIKDSGKPAPARVVVREDGEWMVPVLRGLAFANATEAEAYLLADNRHTELGGYDDRMLAEMLDDRRNEPNGLDGLGWDDAQIDDLISSLSNATDGADVITGNGAFEGEEEVFDESLLKQQKTHIAKLGDVWALGPHRIICGDTGVEENMIAVLDGRLADLVCTDPPYAVFGSSNGMSSSVVDDRMIVPFFEMVALRAWKALKYFGHAYMFCDWRSFPSVWEGQRRGDLSPKNCLVWDKMNAGLGSSYANGYELISFSSKLPKREVMKGKGQVETGQRTVLASNILRHTRVSGDERVHNASKPIALVRQLVRNSTDVGELVLDLFLGGGSTLMACELEGRVCAGIEIDPGWVDVVVARWEKATGQKAHLLRNVNERAEE